MSQTIGFAAEDYAKHYLLEQGLTWISSNYRSRFGEIDLIMRDKEYLVFVEVRFRVSSQFGDAIDSVTWKKQQKIIKTASWYLLTKRIQDKQPSRFDVLSLQGMPPRITWIKNAFMMHV